MYQRLRRIRYVIVEGEAIFDNTEEFKAWHDNLKGKISKYEIERKKRGAPSRRRKTKFYIKEFNFLWLNDNLLSQGQSNGWIRYFQKGMRNADGSPRRPKYMIDCSNVSFIRIFD
ncbi:MAG: hypothetical protein ACTSXD_10545 [Candidatus Heimdallarchaeaceae archaeon]